MRILFKILPVVIFTLFGANMAMAQFTILPSTEKNAKECDDLLNKYETDPQATLSATSETVGNTYSQLTSDKRRADLLACGINRGRISFSMLPYFVTYIANFMLSLGGIIAVLFIVIGGYYYIYGGVMDQKEKGKKTIIHALAGLVMGILSWVIVQVIITAVTS